MLTRRSFLQSSAAAAAFAASAQLGPRRHARRHRHGNQDRPDDALQRSGLGLWRHRQDGGRLFQDDQRAGRRERPQDQPHQPRRRLQPAEDGRADPPPRRAGAGRLPVQQLGTAPNARDPRNISTTTRCRNCSSPPAPAMFGDPQHFPWTMGFQPELSDRGRNLRQAHPGVEARRQDRRALSERRLRQGLPDRIEGRPWRPITRA